MWGFWIRLSPVINLLCAIVKVVSRFRHKRIVMHACLWRKYLNKLDKVMSSSLISLNFQYYNHSLLSYNHSQVIHSSPWKANSGSYCLGPSFSLYLKKLQNIIVLLYLSVFYMHTSEWWFQKNYICRQTVRRVTVLTCKQDLFIYLFIKVFHFNRNHIPYLKAKVWNALYTMKSTVNPWSYEFWCFLMVVSIILFYKNLIH